MAASNHGRRMETLGGMMGSALAMLATAASAARGGPPVVYVDDDAPAGGNGQSWATAFRDLQDAIAEAARRPDLQTEIRIARGVYKPDRGTGSRWMSFSFTSSSPIVLGGFAGLGSADPDERDPARFVTTLSGDLNGDDTPSFGHREDNSQTVAEAGGGIYFYDLTTRLEGLTITGGNGVSGGGLRIGAGFTQPTVVLRNLRIVDNAAYWGGGIAVNALADLQMEDCVVASNWARSTGGGIGTNGSGRVLVSRCVIAGNGAEGPGGCLTTSSMSISITNSLLTGNGSRSGAEIELGYGSSSFICSTLHRLMPSTEPFVRTRWGSLRFLGTIVWSDTAPAANGLIAGGSIDVEASDIRGGVSAIRANWIEWATNNIDATPNWTLPAGPDGQFHTWEDNDYSLDVTSPCMDHGIETHDLGIRVDLFNLPRTSSVGCICASRPDMGAIERQFVCSEQERPRVYVDHRATPGGDGTSWSRALTTLDEALDLSGTREIWIAEGEYSPGGANATKDARFRMNCDLRVYGGFAGFETRLDQRNTAAHRTILTGDLLRNDGEEISTRADNATTIISTDRGHITLDGLILRRASDQRAHAISATESSVRIDGCEIVEHESSDSGALSAIDSDVTIERTLIARNLSHPNAYLREGIAKVDGGSAVLRDVVLADNGQGVYSGVIMTLTLHSDNALLERCVFRGNHLHNVDAEEGGVLFATGDNLTLASCTFENNDGISMYNFYDGCAAKIFGRGTSITNCLFAGNRIVSPQFGRAPALQLHDDAAMIVNCTFVNNTIDAPSASSGAVWLSGSATQLINCIFRDNRAGVRTDAIAQIDYINGALITPVNCNIQNWNDGLPGINTFSANPRFIDPLGPDGVSGTGDEDYRLAADSPCVDAGDTSRLPLDVLDLDRDGNTSEPLPLDLAGAWRVNGAHVDIGAYESGNAACRVDVVADGRVDTLDFFTYLSWFFESQPRADIDRSGAVNSADFFVYFSEWARGC